MRKYPQPYRSLTPERRTDLATVLDNGRVDATVFDHGLAPMDFWCDYWKARPEQSGHGRVTLGDLRDWLGY